LNGGKIYFGTYFPRAYWRDLTRGKKGETMTLQNTAELYTEDAGSMPAYRVDDQDARPWGHYIVLAVGRTPEGEEYCDKQIVIKPGNVLSLQSHDLRRETWTVRHGLLTALVDGERIEAAPGQSVHVPKGSIHCMANLTDKVCVVHERQTGICREEDIKRYIDAYNRSTESLSGGDALPSIAIYSDILAEIGRKNRVQAANAAQ
jgi:mannose-6-phosphate isomerase-like protein (cupin superfamily)